MSLFFDDAPYGRSRSGGGSSGRQASERREQIAYRTDAPEALESDLRTQHVPLDPTRPSETAYGAVYEIDGPLETPSGRIVQFVSIWEIDIGSDVPRFITMYPR